MYDMAPTAGLTRSKLDWQPHKQTLTLTENTHASSLFERLDFL